MQGPGGDQLPAYLSNGVVGLRVRDVPLRVGLATLSGLEGEHPTARVACVPTIPYPLAGDIEIDGFVLSHHSDVVRGIEQQYDFATGELTSRFDIVADRIRVSVEVLTFCSRSLPSAVVQQVRVTPHVAGDVKVTVGIDPTGAAGAWIDRATTVPDVEDSGLDGYLH